MSTVFLDTHDLGEAESVLSTHFGSMSLKPVPRSSITATRFERYRLGSMAIDRVDLGFALAYETRPSEKVALVRVRSGRLTSPETRYDDSWLEAGDVAVFGTIPGHKFHGTLENACYDVLSMDRAIFDQIAAGPESSVQFTSGTPVSDEAVRHMAAAVDYVIEHVAGEPFSIQNPLIASSLQRYVACCMLAAFPHGAQSRVDVDERHENTPDLLRQAIAYIEEHAGADITTADIAEAVYVTPRALQYMFQKYRNCTPTDYMRMVRLHHAHIDLISADRTQTTVGYVARRWGFLHAGRFAVYYRDRYGQSPHAALRQEV